MVFNPVQRQGTPRKSDRTVHKSTPLQEKLLLQRALADPGSLSQVEVRQLQRVVGNRNVQRLVAAEPGAPTVQRQDDDEDWDLGELFKSDEDKEADRAKSTYETVLPGMEKYARRDAPGSLRDKSKAGTLSGVSKALSLPRNADGSLTPDAIKIMDEEQAKEAQGYVDEARKSGFRNAPTDKAGLRALKKGMKGAKVGPADAALNSLTGKSRMPELMNLLDPKGGQALAAYHAAKGSEQSIVTPITVAGVTMHINHGSNDVNFKPRLKQFEGAIEKIQAAGFKLPSSLLVHLPKFGRSIDVKTLCAVGGTPRAVFNPPNFIHLSSAVVGNPIDDTKGGDTLYTLSSQLDPEGPATVVHEMGHLLHHQTSASNFYGLQSASHRQPMVARKVSTYATNNPREFVAEVFLGLVYGKSFDDDVIEMYNAFGGPMSTKIAGQIGKGGPAGGGASTGGA